MGEATPSSPELLHLVADRLIATSRQLSRIVTSVEADLSPFAQLAYFNTSSNGFSETGGASALTFTARSDNAVFTTLGARLAGDFVLGDDLVVTATGALGWRHAFDDAPVSTAAFAGGQSFLAIGTPIASDARVIEAGLKMDLATNVTLALNYSRQFADTTKDHNASAKLAVQF